MTVEFDTAPAFTGFAHPERLVSSQWLADHLGEPGLVVVESDEDVLLYETGHIPTAVKIDPRVVDTDFPLHRIKPFMEIYEEEVALYAHLSGLPFQSASCRCSSWSGERSGQAGYRIRPAAPPRSPAAA